MLTRGERRDAPRLHELEDVLRDALAVWPDLAAGTPLTVTIPVPGLALEGLPAALPDLWYWARPDCGETRFATGTALALEAAGEQRLSELSARLADIRRCSRQLDPADCGRRPAFLLGMDFVAAGSARLVLPLLALDGCAGGVVATFAAVADHRRPAQVLAEWLEALDRVEAALPTPPSRRAVRLTRRGEAPERSTWLRRAAKAVSDIRAGRLDKVVLTRTVSVAADSDIDPRRLTERLAERHPGCAILAVQRPDGILVAATPERLARLSGGRVTSDALAGTCPRSADPRRDLLDNAKERQEHGLVVDWITSGLGDVCTALRLPDGPQVMTLPRLHHLWTPIRGRVRPGLGLLDVLQRLHPTPAVAGVPVALALDWLERHGDHRPDWYTGAAGWVDLDGDGEAYVVLRAALLKDREASLFAGAGIVAGSDPEAEWQETELKLRTLLEAMDG